MVLLDGLADRRWPELGGKTPLEAAKTPNLDRLAARGLTGLMHPLGRGLAPSSEIAHFALFGYSMDEYPGRGVFEAVGHGLEVEDEDVLIHALLASVSKNGSRLILSERPVVADDGECREIVESVGEFESDGLGLKTIFTGNSQGILYVKGGGAREITDSDPYYLKRPVSKILPLNKAGDRAAAEKTARAVTRYLEHIHRVMEAHPLNEERRAMGRSPVNFLLTKWSGKRKKIAPFAVKNGFSAASVCSYPVYRGLVSELGMDLYDAPHLDHPGEDLRNRFKIAEKALDRGMEFIHIHSKAPDDAGHEKDPSLKMGVIEKLDEACGYLFESDVLSDETLVAVTGDHATPSGTELLHSGDPVPILTVGKNTWPDSVREFGETACVAGGLGQMTGYDFMPTILNLTDRVRYLGSSLTPDETLYEPREIPPFELQG